MAKTRSSPFVDIRIDAIGAGGDGVGAYEGKPIYVPKTAPGDHVRVQIEKERVDGIDARLVEIIKPSPERNPAPPSPYYERCGGCALQHVNEGFYRTWKIEKLKTTLQKTGLEPKIWGAPVFLPQASRRRTVLAAVKNGHEIKLGYHAPRSHEITDVRTCAVLSPALDAFAQNMRPYLAHIMPPKKPVSILIQDVDGDFDVVLGGPWQGRDGFSLEQHEALAEMAQKLSIARISMREQEFGPIETILTLTPVIKTFGKLRVSLPPTAFLQASRMGEDALSSIVAQHADGAKNIADLFAGCGTFSGALLEKGMSVTAIENDAPAVQSMTLAARNHKNFHVLKRDLFKDPLTPKELSGFDTVMFDPPRAGAREQCAELAQSAVKRVIAVSCNPGTFARDARILTEGGYTLDTITLIDQFVWSAHIELAALFTRP